MVVSGADTGFRKGWGGGGVTVKYLNMAFLCAHSQRFSPIYDVWGSPKRGGGAPGGPPLVV